MAKIIDTCADAYGFIYLKEDNPTREREKFIKTYRICGDNGSYIRIRENDTDKYLIIANRSGQLIRGLFEKIEDDQIYLQNNDSIYLKSIIWIGMEYT